MSGQHYQRVKDLYLRARGMESAERRNFLRRECDGEAEVRQEVESMLRFAKESPGFLEEPLTPPATILDAIQPDTQANERVAKLADQSNSEKRFVVSGELARGGMGRILDVFDTDLRRAVAMKILRQRAEPHGGGESPVDAATLARFLEEAQVTGQLEHPGVVPVYELGVDGEGRVYFTMRRVQGQEFGAILRRVHDPADGNWSLTRAIGLLQRVCETMAFAHDKGVVHRDLKPANIMVGDYGEVYVMDWGLAHVAGREERFEGTPAERGQTTVVTDRSHPESESAFATLDGTVIGTPHYMPPEQAEGRLDDVDMRSDVYALGAMLYHLLSGRLPYAEGDSSLAAHEVIARLRKGPPAALHRIAAEAPDELIAIAEKAMARRPQDRYADMSAFGADLRAYMEGRVVTAHRTGPTVELVKWVHRNRGFAGACGFAGLALVVGTLVSTTQCVEARDRRVETELALGEARWQDYVANIAAAGASLDMGHNAEARRRLERCPEEHRGWEWEHFNLESDLAIHSIDTGTDKVNALGLTPAGELITASWDRSIRMWDPDGWREAGDVQAVTRLRTLAVGASLHIVAGEGKQIQLFDRSSGEVRVFIDEEEPISHRFDEIALAPDESYFVTASWDSVIRVFDVESGAVRGRFRNHRQAARAVAISPNGRYVGSGTLDCSFIVWEAATLSEVRRWDFPSSVESIYFHADERRVAVGLHNGDVLVVDTVGDDDALLLEGHRSQITALEFTKGSLGEDWLVSGSEDRTVRIWDVDRGENVFTLAGHQGLVSDLVIDHERRLLYTAGASRVVRVWDLDTPSALVSLAAHASSANFLFVTPDGAHLVTGSKKEHSVRVWDAVTGRVLHSISTYYLTLGVTNEHLFIGATWTRPRLEIRELRTGKRVEEIPEKTHCLALSPDGESLAVLGWVGRRGALIDLQSLERTPLPGVSRPCGWALGLLDDGTLLHGGQHWDGKLYFRSGGAEPVGFKAHTDPIRDITIHPDRERVLTASDDGTIVAWDIASRSPIGVLRGHEKQVICLDVSADGTRLVSGSRDRTVRVWDLERMELLATLRSSGTIEGVVYYPDGSRIAAIDADGQLHIWTTRLSDAQELWSSAWLHRKVAPIALDSLTRGLPTEEWPLATADEYAYGRAFEGTRDLVVLADDAWRIATRSNLSVEEYEGALRRIEAYETMSELNASVLHTKGVALVRLGRYREALEVFEHAFKQVSAEEKDRVLPHYLVWEAMCHHHLSNQAKALDALERCGASNPKGGLREYYEEACALIGAKAVVD